ncbi:hypothetical protein MKZ38_000139 [Zalerion maritima]|uniref:A to I editase domain-containing protein n=1 Tax=Zalerion maritima TaxID=339359 RepID=A0AAD5WSR3_9PEZI|nr:hypothetical protein MKZ38_000139 [Zalerion maritima]
MAPASADNIAQAVLTKFDALPPKRKPTVRGNGIVEWVPLSGIVAECTSYRYPFIVLYAVQYQCLKCLPQTRIATLQGRILHDSHAEILALRGFNHYLLTCCHSLLDPPASPSPYASDPEEPPNIITYHHGTDGLPPFKIKEGICLHLYTSEAPCGDSSMELVMAAQEDSTPWPSSPPPGLPPQETPAPPPAPSSGAPNSLEPTPRNLPGRANFSSLSVLRRKPSRADAPPTLSKSCSDKLSLKQCTSLLSSLTSLFIRPTNVYLASIIIPQVQLDVCAPGFARAFGGAEGEGRMAPLGGRRLPSSETKNGTGDSTSVRGASDDNYGSNSDKELYSFHPMHPRGISLSFQYRRPASLPSSSPSPPPCTPAKHSPSNLSTLWNPAGLNEGLINGVLQGRKPTDPKGMSALCRQRMWELAREVASLIALRSHAHGSIGDALKVSTYEEVKQSSLLSARRVVVAKVREKALKGWVRNLGDEKFGLDGDTVEAGARKDAGRRLQQTS